MDPISLIIAALSAGAIAAAKDTAGTAVKDAYLGLKTLIKKKFESDAFGQGMVDGKPEEIKQVESLLKDKLTKAGVDKDAEIIKLAQELLKQEKPEDSAAGKTNVVFQGEVKGAQVGDHNKQENKFG
jgi:hypothetical protein